MKTGQHNKVTKGANTSLAEWYSVCLRSIKIRVRISQDVLFFSLFNNRTKITEGIENKKEQKVCLFYKKTFQYNRSVLRPFTSEEPVRVWQRLLYFYSYLLLFILYLCTYLIYFCFNTSSFFIIMYCYYTIRYFYSVAFYFVFFSALFIFYLIYQISIKRRQRKTE